MALALILIFNLACLLNPGLQRGELRLSKMNIGTLFKLSPIVLNLLYRIHNHWANCHACVWLPDGPPLPHVYNSFHGKFIKLLFIASLSTLLSTVILPYIKHTLHLYFNMHFHVFHKEANH